MKKVTNCLLLLLITCSISFAQTTPSNSVSKPIKLEKNMMIKIPADQDMLYVYEIDANSLTFNSAEQRETYFSGIKDDVVSYRIDKENDKLYLVLDRDYIEKNKWKATEINDHLAKRVTIMEQHYKNYHTEAKE